MKGYSDDRGEYEKRNGLICTKYTRKHVCSVDKKKQMLKAAIRLSVTQRGLEKYPSNHVCAVRVRKPWFIYLPVLPVLFIL